ncbi:hypothetical protein [Parageobacillus thermoglucosidasius]|uniref:hypothetical protein n=1 Tax=Parageobacillus thermoglucosidasius TaxID=1426 RepID=UPI00059B90BD|nr:hypothetical protein [Parageobacillus thermoglucosidasius]
MNKSVLFTFALKQCQTAIANVRCSLFLIKAKRVLKLGLFHILNIRHIRSVDGHMDDAADVDGVDDADGVDDVESDDNMENDKGNADIVDNDDTDNDDTDNAGAGNIRQSDTLQIVCRPCPIPPLLFHAITD